MRRSRFEPEKTRKHEFAALPPRLRPGDALGSFRVEEEISSSSEAGVYAARDIRERRRVALKVLSAHLDLVPEAARRFQAEFEITRRVTHAGIIPVDGWGRDARHSFYAMRLESGETAAALRFRRGHEENGDCFRRLAMLFAAAARALEALHARGIVHRDVKPENLLIGGEGDLILCDFGSALDGTDRDPVLERCLSGTVRYMSPEQFLSAADPYDPAADIYSLGVTLYEVVTGASPFPRCPEKELVRWKLCRLPPAPRKVSSKLPLGLDAIIRRAMDANPRLRHASAGALAQDLERFSMQKRGSSR